MYKNFFFCLLDQLFSRIAEYLKKHDAYDRQGILDAIEYGFSAEQDEFPCEKRNLDRAANFSDWIAPHMSPTPNTTQFRQFKFEKIDGEVTVSARSRCAEDPEHHPWTNLNQTNKPSTHCKCSFLRLN